MEKLVDYIHQHAARYADKPAIVCGADSVTYAELDRLVAQRAQQLTALPQHIVCLRATCSIDFLVTYLALHRRDAVAAPLDKDMPEETFQRIAAELGGHSCPEGTADVLYTTGTTGHSKGVMVSHATIIADAENLIDGQGFCHDTVFIINGPLNHIGSLSKVYPVIMLGATIILVDGLRDINAFYAAFHSESPTAKYATFLVPSSIRILIQLSSKQLSALASRLDFIETGAAAISQSDMEMLCRLLPNTRLYNTYASTETGIIATYNYNDGQCEAGCLGKPMRHSEIMITQKGLIACKGKTLMTGYVGDPERTATVLRDGVLYTSDIGELDAEGRLHLKGREDDVINVGGYKVAPTEVEDAALSYADVKDCVCISVDHVITGKALKLLVVMKEGKPLDKKALATHLKTKLETYKVPLFYAAVDQIERTFNGKLNRKAYR